VVLKVQLRSIERHTAAKGSVIIMVFYFTTSEGYMIYMGADKFENEDLIRYGIPEDLW
jgi:NFACT protein RNA binding domain